jgi:putative transposase
VSGVTSRHSRRTLPGVCPSATTTAASTCPDRFQKELAFLGIESSPAFVRAPQGNGCAERFIRTLKENLLWGRTFDTIEQPRHALIAFREVYNTTWLIERHGFRPPAALRPAQLPPAAKAA